MNDPSPYQPPHPSQPSMMPQQSAVEPAAVGVVGVLHLVFAGLGILTSSWAIYIASVGNPFMKVTGGGVPMTDAMKAQISMQAKIMPASVTAAILSLLVAIPMITAGVRLLQKRRSARNWSNGYAYTSLTAKMINLVLTVTITAPAMREMAQSIMADAHMPGGPGGDFMSAIMSTSAVVSVVLSCIYPVVSLIVLNSEKAKNWFATRAN